MCIDMCIGMCIGMWIGMWIDMCIDMCIDMRIDIGDLELGRCHIAVHGRDTLMQPLGDAAPDDDELAIVDGHLALDC